MSPERWAGTDPRVWQRGIFQYSEVMFSPQDMFDSPCDTHQLTPQCTLVDIRFTATSQGSQWGVKGWAQQQGYGCCVGACSYFLYLSNCWEKGKHTAALKEKGKQCSHISAGWSSRSVDSHSRLRFVLHPHSPDPEGPLCLPSASLSPFSAWWWGW